MREERDDDRLGASLGGLPHDPREDFLMSDVDAVEVAERRDGRMESDTGRLEVSDDLHEAREGPESPSTN
jgi:hypothetical protein